MFIEIAASIDTIVTVVVPCSRNKVRILPAKHIHGGPFQWFV